MFLKGKGRERESESEERDRSPRLKGLERGGKKKEIGHQYMPLAEKMSKTYVAETWRDTGCSLHGRVP